MPTGKMTLRERVLTVLRGGVPDRVPWFADLDYWADAMEQRGERPPGFRRSAAYLDFHRKLNAGFYLQGYWPFRALYNEDVQVNEWTEGIFTHRRVQTPLGMLEGRWRFSPVSCSTAPSRYMVQDASDLASLRYWLEHTRYEPDYALARWRAAHVGDLGVVLAYLPRSPLMKMVVEYAGIVKTVELWVDARSELEAALAAIEAAHDRAAAIALASPAECLMIPENLSAEMIGPRLFEAYMRPYQTRWNRRIREAGKFSFIHMDGTLRGLLGPVASTGFSVIEAFTPAPVGNMDIAEMRERVEPDTVLWGGIPGAFFSPTCSDAAFDAHVHAMLDVMTTQPGFVLGVADQVPPDGLYARVKRVAEIVESRPARM